MQQADGPGQARRSGLAPHRTVHRAPVRPTSRGLVLLAAAAAVVAARLTGLAVLRDLAVLLLTLLAVTALGAVTCAVRLRRRPVDGGGWRGLERTQVGASSTWRLDPDLPWWCLDAVVSVRADITEPVAAQVLSPRRVRVGAGSLVLDVTPQRRGSMTVAVVGVEVSEMLGVWRVRAPGRAVARSLVRPQPSRPRRQPLPGTPGLAGPEGGDSVGTLVDVHTLARQTGRGWDGDLGRLRAYVPGDPPSRVHWRQSARAGELVVVEPDPAEPVLQVRVDRRATSYRGADDAEEAVRQAVGAVAGYRGRVRLVLEPPWEGARGVGRAVAGADGGARVTSSARLGGPGGEGVGRPAEVMDRETALDVLAQVPMMVGQAPGAGTDGLGTTSPGPFSASSGASSSTPGGTALGTSPASSPLRELGSVVVLVAAWWVGLRSLSPVLRPGSWSTGVLMVVGVGLMGAWLAGAAGSWRSPRPRLLLRAAAACACSTLASVVVARRAVTSPRWLEHPADLVREAVELAMTRPAPLDVGTSVLVALLVVAVGGATVTAAAGGSRAGRSGLAAVVPAACLLVVPVVLGEPVPGRITLAAGALVLAMAVLYAPRPALRAARPAAPAVATPAPAAPAAPAARVLAAQTLTAALVLALTVLTCTAVTTGAVGTQHSWLSRWAQTVAEAWPGSATPSPSASPTPTPSSTQAPPDGTSLLPAPADPETDPGTSLTAPDSDDPSSGVVPDLTLDLDHDLLTAPEVPVLRYRTGDRHLSGEAGWDSGLSVPAGSAPRLVLGVVRDLEGEAWRPLDRTDGVPVASAPPGGGDLPGVEPDGRPGGEATSEPAGTGGEATRLEDALERSVALAAQRSALPRLEVQVLALRSAALPVLPATVAVEQTPEGGRQGGPSTGTGALDSWEWVRGTGTATSTAGRTWEGLRYTVTGWSASLGVDGTVLGLPEQVRQAAGGGERTGAAGAGADLAGAAGTGTAGSGAAGTDLALAPYLEVDADLRGAVTPWTTQVLNQAAAGTSALEKAAVLASWFHGNGFVYDAAAPGTLDGNDGTPAQVLSEFVRTRHGYCIHYAAAYTVMARSLGIPTRIAVGLAPEASAWRRADDEGWVAVSARTMHAWPQVWDPVAGWVSVEPTPGAAGGVSAPGAVHAPSSQDPDVIPSPARLTPPGPGPDPDAVGSPAAGASPSGTTSPLATGRSARPGGLIGLAVVAGLAVAAGLAARGGLVARGSTPLAGWAGRVREPWRAWRWRRIRARLQRAERPAELAWRTALHAAGRRQPGAAGRARARTEQALAEAAAEGLPPEAGAALARLARAVVVERYSGTSPTGAAGGTRLRTDRQAWQALEADLATVLGWSVELSPAPGSRAGCAPSARTR